MKDVSSTLKYKGKDYKLIFNFNAMENIQEEFGSLEKWGKLCQPPDKTSEANIKALKFGIAAMINEGIDISNDENGTNDPPVTLKQVGRILSDVGIEQIAKALNEIVIKSTMSNEKNESSTKN